MVHAFLVKLLSVLVLLLSACAGHFDAGAATGFQTLARNEARYWAYVPNDAAQREAHGELMPVLVYLHDVDARGDEPEQATQEGLGAILAKSDGKYPLVVLFPSLKKGAWSDPLVLGELGRTIEDALHRVGGDPDRVYLTGVGMGASGAQALVRENVGQFAALVSLGVPAPTDLGALPVHAFSAARSKDAVMKIYGDPALVEWLLAQRRVSATASPGPAGR